MKVLVRAIAVVALGTGIGQLAYEGSALRDVRDVERAFANGDGLRAELDRQVLLDALKSHDPGQMANVVVQQMNHVPFDQLLLSVKAHAAFLSGADNLPISVKLFDRARAIAPSDRRVDALRTSWQARLHGMPLLRSQSAE